MNHPLRTLLLATACASLTATASAQTLRRVAHLELLGHTAIPSGTQFQGTRVGGLSGLAYDAGSGRYLALADDRSQFGPARFYTLSLGLGAAPGTVQVQIDGVTPLLAQGQPYPALGIDPEGLALGHDGSLYVCSEGDANALLAPFVNRFSLAGELLAALPVPSAYLPTADRSAGIRNNLAFESLTLSPNGRLLYTATENALYQDGPAASLTAGSLSRVLLYSTQLDQPVREYRYLTEPVAAAPVPAGSFATNGLVELLAIDNAGALLALERSFSNGVGNAVRLFETRVVPMASRSEPLPKRLLLDLGQLGLVLDNLEAMAFGPRLADGRELLWIVSDDNFSPTQVTQFLAFAVTLRGL